MTIKECAEYLGMKKSTLRYHYEQLEPQLRMKDDRGQWVVSDEALALIRERVGVPCKGVQETAQEPRKTAQDCAQDLNSELCEECAKTAYRASEGVQTARESMQDGAQDLNSTAQATVQALNTVVEVLRAQLEAKDAEIERLHRELERMHERCDHAERLLANEQNRGFFQRLLGTGKKST